MIEEKIHLTESVNESFVMKFLKTYKRLQDIKFHFKLPQISADSTSFSLLALPEFIPFNNEYDNRHHIPSPSRSRQVDRNHEQETRSQNQNRDRNAENRFSDHHAQGKDNGSKRPSSRESHRSAHSSKDSYSKQRNSPTFSRHSRNRSRSPLLNNARNERTRIPDQLGNHSEYALQGRPIVPNPNRSPSPDTLRAELLKSYNEIENAPNYGRRRREQSRSPARSRNQLTGNYDDNRRSPPQGGSREYRNDSGNRSPPSHPRIEAPRQEVYRRSVDRSSIDRSRNGSSVFDRMSSPPFRRLNESIVSRRSDDSSNGGAPSQFVRTVQVRTYEDALYQSHDRSLEIDPRSLQRDQSSFNNVTRYVEPNRSCITVDTRARSLIPVDPVAELRSYRERLLDAEKHCLGLETTVRTYEREINKLRQIVHTLFADFEVLRSNVR